jgi:hypothetical protein
MGKWENQGSSRKMLSVAQIVSYLQCSSYWPELNYNFISIYTSGCELWFLAEKMHSSNTYM